MRSLLVHGGVDPSTIPPTPLPPPPFLFQYDYSQHGEAAGVPPPEHDDDDTKSDRKAEYGAKCELKQKVSRKGGARAISVEPELIQIVKSAQKTDDRVLKSYELVSQGHQSGFSIHSDDSLRLNGRLYPPRRKENISYSTASVLVEEYEKDVAEFVSCCVICQQVKAERMRPGGILHSLEVPQWNWEQVAMDFVTHLPRTSRHFDAIWVIVDRLSNSVHFILYERTYSYKKMARLYIENVVRLHGVPVAIVSDRDPRFTSKFWTSFQK
ncbi:uncharacterized protein [Primulina eburnea]|uniref:uncharacterized protein n=1 Tax=Primulina eburnea TaxID=1245227 RepID=UPI003C6C5A07